MVDDNQVYYDTLSQMFYNMTGDKLGKQEFQNACVGRPWDEAVRNLMASDRVGRWERWALAGKAGVDPGAQSKLDEIRKILGASL